MPTLVGSRLPSPKVPHEWIEVRSLDFIDHLKGLPHSSLQRYLWASASVFVN
jgi:hypothetical protein